MTKTERHRLIRKLLREHGVLSRSQLETLLTEHGVDCSEDTRRRDYTELQLSGEILFASPESDHMQIANSARHV